MIVFASSSSLREISKQCYRIIYKFHELEKAGKKKNIVNCKNGSIEVFNTLQKDLFVFLEKTVKSNNQQDQEILIRYQKKLYFFFTTVSKNILSKRPLPKKIVSKFLSTITRTMNYIENEEVEIDTDLWSDIVLNAVILWDHKL